MNPTLWLLLAAVLGNGHLVGASLDQTIKQLPTRRRIGAVAFSEYSRAGDLSNGVAWYATLGVGAAVLTVIAAIAGLTDSPSAALSTALWLAVILTIAHSFTTGRAAPINYSQRAAAGDATRLDAIFDRFERWSRARSALQTLTLLAVTWALVAAIATV
jgi:hypothetical protein